MGASTAQDLLNIAPKTFAAIVSIAAVPNFSNLNTIRNKKIWLIHGGEDNENPYAGSEVLYKNSRGIKISYLPPTPILIIIILRFPFY